MENRILVINPGSTSTKIGVYCNQKKLFEKTFRYELKDIAAFLTVFHQKDFRKQHILDCLDENKISLADIDIFAGRGGLLRPMESGTYAITESMLDDLKNNRYGSHVCNLGAVIAYELAQIHQKPSYIVDPVVVDEKLPIANVSGYKGMVRLSIFHALNQKAVAKRYAKEIGRNYNDLNLIVVHMGSGISAGLHSKGKVIDVNNALHGDGPFSPERSGTLPIFQLVEMCFSKKYQESEIKKMLVGRGGLISYLGTSSGIEISDRIDAGDSEAEFYLKAMAYQIIKEVGSLYFVAQGKIDAILFTGGLAYNKYLVRYLKESIDPIMEPIFYPGEDEIQAIVEGVMRVVTGEEEVKTY